MSNSDSDNQDFEASHQVTEGDRGAVHNRQGIQFRWGDSLISGLTVMGVAAAAAYTSTHSDDKAVGITA